MTDKLVKMFEGKYPPVGPHKTSRVSTYNGIERIYLNLLDKVFVGIEKPLVFMGEIKTLTNKIFDGDANIRFEEDPGTLTGAVIIFEPRGADNYSMNYDGHSIQVHKPFVVPVVTLSLANRGAAKLYHKQRNKYFGFVNNLYELYLESAKARNKL